MNLTRLSAFALAAAALAATLSVPPTPVHPVTETLHGVTITDPYRWLEDQDSPETRAWLDAQIRYTQQFVTGIAVRDKIKQRLSQLSRIDTYGLPTERHGRYFFAAASPTRTAPPSACASASTARMRCWSTPPISARTKPPRSSSGASRAMAAC